MKAYQKGAVRKEAALTFISTQKLALKDELRLLEVFRALDTNSDGRISREEFINGFNKRNPGSITELEANELMDRVGRSGSGFIDYTEFIKSACARRVLLSKANLLSAFSVLDEDKDGTISAEEIRKSLGICELKKTLINRIVAEVDEDGDGLIDIQEFTHMMEDS
jgi:Ca2+-binding EF-hand superfamily protein